MPGNLLMAADLTRLGRGTADRASGLKGGVKREWVLSGADLDEVLE